MGKRANICRVSAVCLRYIISPNLYLCAEKVNITVFFFFNSPEMEAQRLNYLPELLDLNWKMKKQLRKPRFI